MKLYGKYMVEKSSGRGLHLSGEEIVISPPDCPDIYTIRVVRGGFQIYGNKGIIGSVSGYTIKKQ